MVVVEAAVGVPLAAIEAVMAEAEAEEIAEVGERYIINVCYVGVGVISSLILSSSLWHLLHSQ